MQNLIIEVAVSSNYSSDKNSCKLFYVVDKYLRTVMFSSRIERFCASELSGAGKNHGDTFRRHQKDTMIMTQKRLKTGKKDVMKIFFLPGH